MKDKNSWVKLTMAGIASALLFSNCTTTYDASGRPVQTVDAGAAAVGAVVLTGIAFAVGHNNRHSYNRHHYNRYAVPSYRSRHIHRERRHHRGQRRRY